MMTDDELLELYKTGKTQKEKDFIVEKILKNIEPYIKRSFSSRIILLHLFPDNNFTF